MANVCFFTVCWYKDYDYILGAIEHHARMGKHLVLDTSPPEHAIQFKNLPPSVLWMHEPFYGAGWKNFRLRTAVEHAMEKARLLETDILVYLDADEFYIHESAERLFPWAKTAMVEVQCVHWKPDGKAYVFGPSEWHCRLWPAKSDARIVANTAWLAHPKYNGNPEHHPVPVHPPGLPVVRVYGEFRHHLHYAFGPKVKDVETAVDTVDGWLGGGHEVPTPELPERLKVWRDKGIPPRDAFL